VPEPTQAHNIHFIQTGTTANSIAPLPDNRSYLADFYVITTIFNPASYKSRYSLYHDFAKHIQGSGAKLVTVECIFPSLGQETFQVTRPSSPLHIQLKSESVYWVKEDLINIAVKSLPPNARWVTWLDADIYFHQPDWIEQTISTLERHTVVQMFRHAHSLNADGKILRTDYSFGYSVVKGKPIVGADRRKWYPHPGYGWAMSRSDFEKIGGLPNYSIVGSGDLYFAYTLVNHIGDVIRKGLNEDYSHMMQAASERTYQLLRNLSMSGSKTIVGFLPVGMSHRWHGSRKDRGYVDRLNILLAHHFNYFKDMYRGSDGLLRFGNATEALQQDVRCYFEKRNEDSNREGRVDCNSPQYQSFLDSLPRQPVLPAELGNFYNFYMT